MKNDSTCTGIIGLCPGCDLPHTARPIIAKISKIKDLAVVLLISVFSLSSLHLLSKSILSNRFATFFTHNRLMRRGFDPLMGTGNYSVTSNNTKLVHLLLMGGSGLLHLVQRGGAWARPQPPRPLLAVPNATAHPSTASVPVTVYVRFSAVLMRPLKGE